MPIKPPLKLNKVPTATLMLPEHMQSTVTNMMNMTWKMMKTPRCLSSLPQPESVAILA